MLQNRFQLLLTVLALMLGLTFIGCPPDDDDDVTTDDDDATADDDDDDATAPPVEIPEGACIPTDNTFVEEEPNELSTADDVNVLPVDGVNNVTVIGSISDCEGDADAFSFDIGNALGDAIIQLCWNVDDVAGNQTDLDLYLVDPVDIETAIDVSDQYQPEDPDGVGHPPIEALQVTPGGNQIALVACWVSAEPQSYNLIITWDDGSGDDDDSAGDDDDSAGDDDDSAGDDDDSAGDDDDSGH